MIIIILTRDMEAHVSFGDEPIDLTEPQLTHGEAVEITGVTAKTLNNWTAREVIDLGIMHRTGRRLYSIVDLIQLKIVGELSHMVQMPPAHAATVGRYAIKRFLEMARRDEDGKLIYKGPAVEVRHFLIIWFDTEGHKILLVKGADFLTEHSYPHPIVVVPLDDIVTEVSTEALFLLEREYLANEGADSDDE